MARFAVDWEFGEDQEHRLEVRPDHREYLKQLAERGILLASGPYADNLGALLIYDVADTDELQQVLDGDPYSKAGVIAKTTIREWTPLTGSWVA